MDDSKISNHHSENTKFHSGNHQANRYLSQPLGYADKLRERFRNIITLGVFEGRQCEIPESKPVKLDFYKGPVCDYYTFWEFAKDPFKGGPFEGRTFVAKYKFKDDPAHLPDPFHAICELAEVTARPLGSELPDAFIKSEIPLTMEPYKNEHGAEFSFPFHGFNLGDKPVSGRITLPQFTVRGGFFEGSANIQLEKIENGRPVREGVSITRG